jgi:3-deoxy-manno-octulosonate cytidylyltransferase (CMP-KDO synthetase)
VRTVAIIPARLGSTRLPEKALADIGGRPMIARVVEQVLKARGLAEVIVATDARAIAEAAERAGARAIMTSAACATGTDRVAEAVRTLDADLVLNIQGDEPLLPPEAVETLLETLQDAAARGIPLATLARPLLDDEAALPQVVKVVLAEDRTALYFSRSLIPYPRSAGLLTPLAHVGLYGYTRAGLERLSSLAPTALEQAEGLEQLRALGHGLRMAVGLGRWRTQAVDTAEDLARVRATVAECDTFPVGV